MKVADGGASRPVSRKPHMTLQPFLAVLRPGEFHRVTSVSNSIAHDHNRNH